MVTKYLVAYDSVWRGGFLHNTVYCDTLRRAIDTVQSTFFESTTEHTADDEEFDCETLCILECTWDIEEELGDDDFLVILENNRKPDTYYLLWSARYSQITVEDLKPEMLSKSRLNIEDTKYRNVKRNS